MVKVCRVGSIKIGGRWASIYINIKMPKSPTEIYSREHLSITGVIGALSSGNALGGCGQIDMEFEHRNKEENDSRYSNRIKPADILFAKGWDAKKWYDLLEIWNKWHLKAICSLPIHIKKFFIDLPVADRRPAWV